MKWNICCDSSCDITELKHLADDTIFTIAPLKINIGATEFTDDASLNTKRMVDAMVANKGMSSTACPAPFDWTEKFMMADYTIAITISDKLSGSYNSAVTAKDMIMESHPEKRIHIVNSKSTSGTMILLAMKVNTLIKEGKSFEEVVNEIDKYNNTMELIFCLMNYDNLIKAGRMNAFVGAVATALKIRAIAVRTPIGQINVINKLRGDMLTYKFMVKHMAETKDLTKDMIIISHCRNEDGAKKIKEYLNDMGIMNVYIIETRGLCSYYANVGGIIVSY